VTEFYHYYNASVIVSVVAGVLGFAYGVVLTRKALLLGEKA